MPADQIHLVRHGEVHNPDGVLYGQLPNFRLSDRGERMAHTAADELKRAGRPVSRLIASPLQRAQESAAPIAAAFDLPIDTEPRIIEPTNRFEGLTFEFGPQVLLKPRSWPWVRNPFKPSWGEAYASIVERMRAAITDAHASVDSGDVVLVSHQLPIWMVHRSVAGKTLWHDPRQRRCTLSSITSFELHDGQLVEVGYREPAAELLADAVDQGAV
ncbi:MAG TPA: histidine phosphatase family protein [Terrimesophilobacter sp.]|nr:histidine phosphatase family protein [Terrimesophilobacter sp.]